MNEDPQAWAAAHGGLDRTEGPNANGDTIYYAKSGDYITVRKDGTTALRGFTPPSDGAGQAPPTETSAAAPRGAGMNQQELEALLAQRGTFGPNDFREETKMEDVPNPQSSANGGPDATVPATTKAPVTYRTWIKPGTNQRLTVKVNPDGSYAKTFDGPDPQINPDKQAGDQATAPHVEGTPLPGGGFDNSQPIMVNRDANGKQIGPARPLTAQERTDWERQKNGGKTDQEIRDQGEKPKTTRVNPNDTTKVQEFDPATGTWVDGGPNDAEIQKRKKDAEDAARLNKPTVRSEDITINGKHFTRVTTTPASGQTTVQNMGPDGKPVEALPDEVKPGTIVKGGGANGEDVQAVADPEHPGQVKYVPIPGAPKPPKVDLPALKMEAGQVSQEVIDRWNELNQKFKNGDITKEQAIKEFEPIHAAAETRLTEIKSVFDQQNSLYSSAQTQRGQDLHDVESRRTAATSAANDAAAYGRTVLGKPGLGNADLAAAEDYVVQRALRAQTSFGGDRQVPQAAPGPALQQANTLTLPGMPTAAGLGDAAPSATGGMVPAPAAPAPAQTPEQAAAARLVNPAFRPAPPTNVTATPGAAPLPTAAAANPPSGDAQVGNPTSTPANPPAGEPGNDPSAPVALTPTPAEQHAASGGSVSPATPMVADAQGGAPILSLDIPGVGPLKIYSPGQRKDSLQQSADFVGLKTPTAPSVDAPSVSAMGAPQSPDGDPNDMLKRLRRIGGNDPSWMQANDALSQQYSGVA